MLADQLDYVVGVDTHRDAHSLALLTATGGLVFEAEIDADRRGYERALLLAREHAAGGTRLWAIEGSGSYGAGLARFLAERGERSSRSGGRSATSAGTARATGSTPCGRRGWR